MRDGNGREDYAKGSPGRDDLGFGMPDRARLNQRGRKTVEGERDKSAGVGA